MRVKGALHVHSTLSHDGTLTIPELAMWYKPRGYHFIAIGEHSQDLDEGKVELLKEQCAEFSGPQFLIIPGIEYSCRDGIHLFGIAATGLTRQTDPVAVVHHIHDQGAFAILVHPKRLKWNCAVDLLNTVDAVEIWNVAYDGKYLPPYQAPDAFRRMRRTNPRLLAVAGHDLHRKAAFHDVGIETQLPELSSVCVLRNLREGAYVIRSRFFRADSHAPLSWTHTVLLSFMSWHLNNLRKARDALRRWCS